MHIERLGKDEVRDILTGTTYIFPKIHGSNAYVLFDEKIRCFSRNHELVRLEDNSCSNNNFTGFLNYATTELVEFFRHWPNYILYGEYTIPHAGVEYKEEYKNKFFVFDVFDKKSDTFLDYYTYSTLCYMYDIPFLPLICSGYNMSEDNIRKIAESDRTFLSEKQQFSEGVVIKRYDYINPKGRTIWAKYVNEAFIDAKGIKLTKIVSRRIEDDFIEANLDKLEITKEKDKLVVENGNKWENKLIPILGQIVFDSFMEDYSHLTEELDNAKLRKSIMTVVAIKSKE